MKIPWQFLSRCYRDAPPRIRRATFACIVTLALMAVALATVSCASTPLGLSREQALYRAGTNVVATVHTVTPYLPARAGGAVEGLLALATAALADWNTHLHTQMRTLRNGNGHGAKGSPGAAPLGSLLHPDIAEAVPRPRPRPRLRAAAFYLSGAGANLGVRLWTRQFPRTQ